MEIIKSTRFQSLVLLSIVIMLGQYDIISWEIVNMFQLVLGASIGIRTIDRIGEKIGKK